VNTYTKNYTSKYRAVENTEVHHVVIFPCDNSFSIVKSKQCSPAEQDDFVMVQSGGKKYMGFFTTLFVFHKNSIFLHLGYLPGIRIFFVIFSSMILPDQ
jgi:hypothetical protein